MPIFSVYELDWVAQIFKLLPLGSKTGVREFKCLLRFEKNVPMTSRLFTT
jgi:hypothetical protein